MLLTVAIVTLVLPSAENRAKDMGIVNIANTLPHSLAPVLAGVIFTLTHSYAFLYIAAAVFVLLGALLKKTVGLQRMKSGVGFRIRS